MSTGIPFLDGLINGVNDAVTSASNFLTNVNNSIATTTTQAQNQLGNFISGVTNGITGIINGAANQVIPTAPPPTTYNYNPNQNGFFQSQYLPVGTGQPLLPPGAVQTQSSFTIPGFDLNAILQQISNANLNNLNFATLNSSIMQVFQQLPSLIAGIQNPLNSPLFGQLTQLIQSLYNQQAQTVSAVQQLVKDVESHLYQSTSNTLNSIGIDVGQFSNLLDASVRTVMEQLGYDFNQRMADIHAMQANGEADLNQKIYNTQAQLNQFLQTLSYEFADTNKILKSLSDATPNYTPDATHNIINDAVDTAGKELVKVLSETLDYGLKNPNSFLQVLSTRIDKISGVIDQLKQGRFKSSDEFFNALFGNDTSSGLARGLIILASVIPTLISAVQLAGEPALESFSQLVQADGPVKLLSPSDYLTAYFKKVITYDQLVDYLKKQGISEENTVVLAQASITDPDFGTMLQAKRRGIINDTEWKDYALDQRLDSRSIEIIEHVADLIPGVQDLTRIADKRIWGLNLPEKYGQYSELPQQYLDYMKQQGFGEQFTKWFWAAHWSLPSPNQIFEMFQRHVISNDDMQAYLALTDWLPFFRDKLLAISYNPLTRVDIRRMYGLGLIPYNELHTRYEAIGFSPADAELMARFTARYEEDSGTADIDKLKAKIVTAVQGLYVRGKLDREQSVLRLVALGKDRQIAELMLSLLDFEHTADISVPKLESYKTRAIKLIVAAYLKGHYQPDAALTQLLNAGLSEQEAREELRYADLERTAEITANIVDTMEARYLNGVYSQADFISQLSAMGLNSNEVAQALSEADLKREKKLKLPSEKQMVAWYNAGVVTEEQVVSYLKQLGYTDEYIPLVLMGDYGAEGLQ